jgi:hypothetical protein
MVFTVSLAISLLLWASSIHPVFQYPEIVQILITR